MSLLTLVVVFGIAACLRSRNVRWYLGIPASAAITPLAVAFESFVYPADPESKMWASIAIPVSYTYALVAASIGYGVTTLVKRYGDA